MSFNVSPDLLSFSMRSRTNASLRARMQSVSQEAVTGLRADVMQPTRGRLGQAHLLSKAINDLEQSRQINSLSSARLDMFGTTVSSAREAAAGIDSQGLIALNSEDQASTIRVNRQARAAIDNLAGALKIKQGSRYLLSGDQTDVPPLADMETVVTDVRNILSVVTNPADAQTALDFYFNDPAGGFSTTIYQGGTGAAPPILVGTSQTVQINTRADNQEFRDLIYGLSVMSAIDDTGPQFGTNAYGALYTNALSRIGDGLAGTIETQSTLGIHSETIEGETARLNAEALILSDNYQSVFGRDQFEAAAELKQLEVQLEASYAITARLSNLTLTNYLR